MKKRGPLRRRLFLLALAVILPLALMSAVGLNALFQQQKLLAEQSALGVTRALATAVDAELRLSVGALETLATAAASGDLDRFESLRDLSHRVLQTRSEWRQILLADVGGQIVMTTRQQDQLQQAVSERESFDALLKTRQPVVGYIARGPQGNWGVPVRVPVFKDNQLRYVLTGILRPDSVVNVMTRQGIPEGWVASIFDGRGSRVARSRLHEASL